MTPEPTMRTFELAWLDDPAAPGSSAVYTKTISAAYWTTDGDTQTIGATGKDIPHTLDFISFKDDNHKRVYTIRRSMVLSIQELRNTDQPFSDIIDADPYKTDTGTAWDREKILRGVLRGRLAIDSARVLLGYKPFNIPETLRPFRYTQCPNGCDGDTGCSDCPDE